ncbi:MAG: nucleotidyltransferase domain-containing protein [Candidatus Methanoperedens sp.]|nr:nucleotidyltransferase domain-containing protein [Candidatus Methanoperedens sp.]
MSESKLEEAIKFLGRCLKEKGLKVSKIILFGSQVKGKTTEESDVDILIISEDFSGKDIFERARLTKYAEIMTLKKFMMPLDIVTLTSEEFERGTSLVVEYAKRGKVMYAA